RRRHTRFSRDWSSDVCSSDVYFSEVSLDVIGKGLESIPKLVTILMRSNDGSTTTNDVARLLETLAVGSAESKVGVVSYGSGFFHPKVYHITRFDGSESAYVG